MSYATKFHPDGSVTLWCVYRQQWVRTNAPEDRNLASMSPEERERVLAHIKPTG